VAFLVAPVATISTCDWAEKLLGQPFRFFGAYVNSRTEDLACAHFEPVKRTEIEKGFRSEMRALGLDNDNGRALMKVGDWHASQSSQRGYDSPHFVEYSETDMGLLKRKRHFRGVIEVPDSRYFDWRRHILFDVEWKCCASRKEGGSESASESDSENTSESASESMK
jgi:hypothetical protein